MKASFPPESFEVVAWAFSDGMNDPAAVRGGGITDSLACRSRHHSELGSGVAAIRELQTVKVNGTPSER